MTLLLINKDNRMTARQLAAELGITERSVRRIIKNLQVEGYLQINKEGRSNRYQIKHNARLRRQALGSKTVGELIKALS
jgi:predicted ArsR family transcriptional regulator